MGISLLAINNDASIRSQVTARIISGICFGVMGFNLVDMPVGHLGPTGLVSQSSLMIVAALVALGALAVTGLYLRTLWSIWLAKAVVFSFSMIFVLGVGHDPLVSGLFAFWHLWNFSRMVSVVKNFKNVSAPQYMVRKKDITNMVSDLKVWFLEYRQAASHLLFVALVTSVLVFGFKLTEDQFTMIFVHLLLLIVTITSVRFLYLMIRHSEENRRETLVAFAFLLGAIVSFGFLIELSGVFIFLFFVAVFWLVFSRNPIVREGIDKFREAPAVFFVASFLLLISAGTLFLSMPESSSTGESIGFLNAFFTSVSAACVTGLTVIDPGKDLSHAGQIMLLILIQLGGLGIMVLSTFATIAFGGRLGVKTQNTLSEFLGARGVKSANKLVFFIIKSTIIIEATGAAILTYVYMAEGLEFVDALKYGVFHSISAFCNAGFSLVDTSLISLNQNPLAMLTFSVLIIAGGLGFFVTLEIFSRLLGRRKGPMSPLEKLVVFMSLGLVISGGLIFTIVEWNTAFADLSIPHKFLNGFFHSVTLRTAGFNSIPMESLAYPSYVVMIIFMFIGGAPGGTAGGVKVTTIGVLLATLPALLRQSNRVSIFKRNLTAKTVYESAAILVLSLSAVCVCWFLLLLSQNIDPLNLLFEVFSAIGTVGLTLGVTSNLDNFGQVIIAAAMFIGRIGPITVAIALAKETKSKVEYPTASMMVG